jgi:Asp-tRNA(Asn)/Glu-tRNA(Gln) amidotransferase A subunit family amidase
VSIEFLGEPFSEARLLGLAHDFQSSYNHRKSPASTPSLKTA